MSPTEIRIEALRIDDPDWFTNHPGALEEMLSAETDGAEREQDEETDRTMDRLDAIVDRCRGVRSYTLGAHRTLDGFEYEVRINPWSERRARRIERKAAPIPVVVGAAEHESESEYGRHVRAAIDSVRASRGLSQAAVEEHLRTALERREVTLPQRTVQGLARDISDPWWPLKHPVQLAREFRGRKRVDPESARCEAEAADLGTRLEGLLEVEEIASRRTLDGIVHEVTLDPWSKELADRVHRFASPIKVNVKPRT